MVLDVAGKTRFKRAPGLDISQAEMVAVDDADVLGRRPRVYSVTVLPSGQPGRANSHELRLTNVAGHRALDGRANLVGVDDGKAVFWDRTARTVSWSDAPQP